MRNPQRLGLWLTQEQIHESGPVFGGPSLWKGVSIAVETNDDVDGEVGNLFVALVCFPTDD